MDTFDVNIAAEFEPLKATRDLILDDAELLARIADVWFSAAYGMVQEGGKRWWSDREKRPYGYPRTGFRELTELLAYWCDASPYSIDPSALTDMVYLNQIEVMDGPSVGEKIESRDVVQMMNRALLVYRRILYVVAALTGKEPPETANVGRPTSELRLKVEKLLEDHPDISIAQIQEQIRNISVGYVRTIKSRWKKKIRGSAAKVGSRKSRRKRKT